MRKAFLVFSLLLVLSFNIFAEEEVDLEAEVEMLNQIVASLGERLEDMQKSQNKLRLGSGYFQVLYVNEQKKHDPIRINRLRFSVVGNVTDKISFKIQPDFGKLSRDGNVELKDAWIDLKYLKDGLVRVGQLKLPFGYELWLSDSKRYTVTKVNYVKECFSDERDYGIGIFGDIKGKKNINYGLSVVNGTGKGKESNRAKDVVGKIVYEVQPKISEVGISFYSGRRDKSPSYSSTYGIYFLQKHLPFVYILEHTEGKDKSGLKNVSNTALWIVGTPIKEKPYFESILRYEIWDPNTKNSNDRCNIITAGFNYYLDKQARIMINYEIKDEEKVQIKNNVLNAQLQVNFK